MNNRLQNVLMIVAVLCALATTGMLVRKELQARARPEQGQPLDTSAPLIDNALHVSGPSDAQVTLIEFFDLQCPACRRFSFSIDSVVRAAPFTVRIVRHHFPLVESHLKAQDLALAAICLRDRPQLFEEYYHRAFEYQRILNDSRTVTALSLLPPAADSTAVHACMQSTATLDLLNAELRIADSLSLRATPSFIVGNRLYTGGRSAADLQDLLQKEVK